MSDTGAKPQPVREDAHVSYGVKDLLSEIKSTVVGMDAKLDSKADKADLAVVVQRVDDHDRRLDRQEWTAEITSKESATKKDQHRFKVPLIISIATAIASPFLWNVVNHMHL